MISVAEALERITGAFAPLPLETVALTDALGRALGADVVARMTQPPVAVSAMDGYAVRADDTAASPVTLRVVGEAPAGGAYGGRLAAGEAVRIFTGGPVPDGANAIVIQESTDVGDGTVTVREGVAPGRYVRRAGLDFEAGWTGLRAGHLLSARDIGLAAAMNHPWLKVRRTPRIAVLTTGDEIVMPGEMVGPHQIVSSNTLAMEAALKAFGAEPVNLGIAPDDSEALRRLAAGARGADLLITTGGISVGDHDIVRQALGEDGFTLDFWKIAMRPGKPMAFGRLGETPLLGLPGNPVSAVVCALIFAQPAIATMLGLDNVGMTERARLGCDLSANDERQEFLRSHLRDEPDGSVATPFQIQDSSMLSDLARADCLVVRPPHAKAAAAGESVEIRRFGPGRLNL